MIEKNEEDLANFIAKTDILIKGLAFRMEPLEYVAIVQQHACLRE